MNECPHGYPEGAWHRCAFCKHTVQPQTTMTLGIADWEREAKKLVWKFAREGFAFTSEDVTDQIGFPDVTHHPNGRNNRIGALIQSLAKSYRLRRVDLVKARNKQSNGRALTVWKGAEWT